MNVELYWEQFHNKIKNIHLADNENKETDHHPALGSGKIDFQNVFNLAKRYEYNGPMIVEIITGRALRRSIDFINKYF